MTAPDGEWLDAKRTLATTVAAMRAAVFAALVVSLHAGASLTASASPYHAHRVAGSPFSDVIVAPPKRQASSGPKAFTSVSRVIYLNRCAGGGCTVRPGADDVHANTSSIANQQTLLTEWPHGDEKWNTLVQCVRDLYAPFNIQITDVDPGAANHFEVMVAGNAAALDMEGAGGVAPFEPCNGELQDNVISFVFAADLDNQDFMCWAAAQESSHVFGLDHELNAKDPMTYLAPPMKKPGFQNVEAKCGEEAGQPRECWCGGDTQNSYQYLMDLFGPAMLEPATLSISEPVDGAWVKPGFNVRAELVSQLSMTVGSLHVDGTTSQSIQQGDPLVWNTSATLAGGDHKLTIEALDTADRTLISNEITVHVTQRCDGNNSCESNTHCLGGFCLPGKTIAGGLGAACTGADECITGQCSTDGVDSVCTGACDGGTSCPSGYACYAAGASSVCWPVPPEDTGCSTSSPSGKRDPMFAIFGLGVLVLVTRRRRRR
jgi:MYXO-CTERM domain-containing protein